eukprot:8181246-Lingulodinium_polyedra.AAC.1
MSTARSNCPPCRLLPGIAAGGNAIRRPCAQPAQLATSPPMSGQPGPVAAGLRAAVLQAAA